MTHFRFVKSFEETFPMIYHNSFQMSFDLYFLGFSSWFESSFMFDYSPFF
jgi:hypothetical protein